MAYDANNRSMWLRGFVLLLIFVAFWAFLAAWWTM